METRKHSSRMHTVHSSPYRGSLCLGVSLTETPLDRDPQDRDPLDRDPQTETHSDRELPGYRKNMGPETETPRRNMRPGSQTGSDIIQRPL